VKQRDRVGSAPCRRRSSTSIECLQSPLWRGSRGSWAAGCVDSDSGRRVTPNVVDMGVEVTSGVELAVVAVAASSLRLLVAGVSVNAERWACSRTVW